MGTEKKLILGTALWGWKVNKLECFRMLDILHERTGNALVDTAINYPINKNKSDFGKANLWLKEWLKINTGKDLKIIQKVGSLDNTGNPNCDLTSQSIIKSYRDWSQYFRNSLFSIGVHWDNRLNNELIYDTLSALSEIKDSGFKICLSGIKFPKIYKNCSNGFLDDCMIQVKENIASNKARMEYEKYFPNAKYIAYGINMGGLKKSKVQPDSSLTLRNQHIPTEISQSLEQLLGEMESTIFDAHSYNDLALLFSFSNPKLDSVIVGPSNENQLIETLDFWAKLANLPDTVDFLSVYCQMKDYVLEKSKGVN